jgi:hypothetical protein
MNVDLGRNRGVQLVFAICALGLFLSNCAQSKVNKSEMSKVKTVAVLVYTVPTAIVLKQDGRTKPNETLAQSVATFAGAGNGEQAATVSYQSFVTGLQGQNLPFRVLSADDVRNNAAIKALAAPPAGSKTLSPDAERLLGQLGFKSSDPNRDVGLGPDGLAQFGLPLDWDDGDALAGTDAEKTYLLKAMEALNVDAAIVVTDIGYSWFCNYDCVGNSKTGTNGVASTQSSYLAALVNRKGQTLLSQREWFQNTDANAPLILSTVASPLQPTLYKAHGARMAKVFAVSLQKAMAKQ